MDLPLPAETKGIFCFEFGIIPVGDGSLRKRRSCDANNAGKGKRRSHTLLFLFKKLKALELKRFLLTCFNMNHELQIKQLETTVGQINGEAAGAMAFRHVRFFSGTKKAF